jgi:hypothetical protein
MKADYERKIHVDRTNFQSDKESYISHIKELENKLENLAIRAIEKPTNQTNNSIKTNNYINMPSFSDLTPEYVSNQVEEHFNLQYFAQGQKGVARFAYNKLLKDTDGNLYLECTDPSRHVFRFKDELGNVIRDVKAKRLTSIIAEPVMLKSNKILEEVKEEVPWMEEQARKINITLARLGTDNVDLCKELGTLTSATILIE